AHIDHSIGETTHDLPRHGKKQLPGQADEIVGLLAVNHGSPPGLAVYINTAYSNVGKFQTSIISKSSLRAPHSGHTQLGGTSSQRVPGGIPSSGRPASSS